MQKSNRFYKAERITKQKHFDDLRKDSRRIHHFPLLGFWKITQQENAFGVKVAFTVPKKNFPNASERNLIKRRLREAYRQGKHKLNDTLLQQGLTIHLSILVLKTDNTSYDVLRAKLMLLLRDIAQRVEHD